MLTIVYRSVSDLRPDPNNPRVHPKKQIAQIARSITEFGFTNPILIDEGKVLIAGHGRLLAAKSVRMDQIPTITLVGLTPHQKTALMLADNKIPAGSSWDADLVSKQLSGLASADLKFSIELTGFSGPEIDVAIRRVQGKLDDAPPREWAPPTAVKAGDIWILGKHRVACGDCRDKDLMGRLMAGAQADAAFLDPPYNVPISGFAVGRNSHAEFAEAVGEMTSEQFTGFLKDTLGAAVAITRPGGVHFVAMDWRHITELSAAGSSLYGKQLNICVWNKSNAGMGSLYRSKHELIFVYRVGDVAHFNGVELGRHGRHRSNVWEYSSVNSFNKARQADLKLHPTVKPVQMVADAFMDVTRPGEVVFDGYLGSGTSLVAAEQTNRIFRGIELDPGYVEVALDRWARLTCQTPRLEGTGETIEDVQLAMIPEAV